MFSSEGRYLNGMVTSEGRSRLPPPAMCSQNNGLRLDDVNIFAYADDIVLLAPAWAALQDLILLVSRCCQDLGLTFNVKKSKCMIINPVDKKKIVSTSFPQFIIDGRCMQFVSEFRYLGHVLTDNLHDDADIKREIRNMLIQRFSRCSQHVKIAIFRTFFICLYGVPLWSHYTIIVLC